MIVFCNLEDLLYKYAKYFENLITGSWSKYGSKWARSMFFLNINFIILSKKSILLSYFTANMPFIIYHRICDTYGLVLKYFCSSMLMFNVFGRALKSKNKILIFWKFQSIRRFHPVSSSKNWRCYLVVWTFYYKFLLIFLLPFTPHRTTF